MTNPTYDVYYFIRFFAAIPEERWCVGYLDDGDGRHCAIGHCPNESTRFLWEEYKLCLAAVNDGEHPRYQQSTPKRRVLAALRDVACSQLGEDTDA